MPLGLSRRARSALPAALLSLPALALVACASSTEAPASPAEAAPAPPETQPSPPVDPEVAAATFDDVWTTVRDSHFDPTFNGVDWDAVGAELRPRAAAATTQRELRSVLSDMLERLGQSHFSVLPRSELPELDAGDGGGDTGGTAGTAGVDGEEQEETDGDLGFDVRSRGGAFLVTRVDQGGPAEAAGVRPGWILARLYGDDLSTSIAEIEAVEDERAQRYASFEAYQMVAHRMLGPVGTEVPCAFEDQDGREVEVMLRRAERDAIAHEFGTSLPTFHLLFESDVLERNGKRVGWIHFTNWFVPMVRPINDAVDRMRGCDGIVLDLRGNTGGAGHMAMGVAGHFFGERTHLGTTTMRDGEMKFISVPQKVNSSGQLVAPFTGPVAILIDDISGSTSEVFAGGMQSTGRARVFGETSAGAVLPAAMKDLPNGDGLLYAIGDFKTAQGELLEGRGVVPDVPVALTREALLADGDPALEAAVAWIIAPRID